MSQNFTNKTENKEKDVVYLTLLDFNANDWIPLFHKWKFFFELIFNLRYLVQGPIFAVWVFYIFWRISMTFSILTYLIGKNGILLLLK